MTAGESRSGRRERLDKLRESILHRKVLARHLPGLNGTFSGRWTRRQWAHASLFATLGALVAAVVPGFSGPAAGTMQASLSAPRITQALVLPALAAAPRQDIAHDNWRQVTVESGQTLGRIFEDLDLPASSWARMMPCISSTSAVWISDRGSPSISTSPLAAIVGAQALFFRPRSDRFAACPGPNDCSTSSSCCAATARRSPARRWPLSSACRSGRSTETL